MTFKKTATIVAAAGALTALAIPAMAELTPYASVRLGAFYNVLDPQSTNSRAGVGRENQSDFDLDLARNSRVGIKGSTGAIGGVVELGLGSSNNSTTGFTSGFSLASATTATNNGGFAANTGHVNNVYTRLIYGTYKFDAGTLLVGQDYSNNWVTSAQSWEADKGFSGYGSLDNSRQAQIKFTMNNGLYFAAINPSALSTGTYEITIPVLNVGYKGKAGNFDYNFGVLYGNAKSYNGNDTVATHTDNAVAPLTADGTSLAPSFTSNTINAYLGYGSGKLTAGPVSFLFNLGYGQNTGDLDIRTGRAGQNTTAMNNNSTGLNAAAYTYVNGVGTPAAGVTGNRYIASTNQNVITTESFAQMSYQASDTAIVNLGVGYVSDKRKEGTMVRVSTTGGSNDGTTVPATRRSTAVVTLADAKADNRIAAFINVPITIAKGFTITPEVSYIDELKDNGAATLTTALIPERVAVSQQKEYAIGAKLQMDF